MENQEFVSSLRAVTDFYEKHTELPLPDLTRMSIYSINTVEEIEPFARAFGSSFKEYTSDFFKLVKRFGVIDLEVVAYRSQVCIRKVVGKKKEIQRKYPENVGFIEQEVEVDIVEWECPPSILQSKPTQAVLEEVK